MTTLILLSQIAALAALIGVCIWLDRKRAEWFICPDCKRYVNGLGEKADYYIGAMGRLHGEQTCADCLAKWQACLKRFVPNSKRP